MKGVLAERMLRRLRYKLVTRLFRFPKPYFQRTSQAEIVSMVTSESEPLGGMMGDAISQPILQAGQMITILTFLFLQSFWFGLAAISMIPLQAWLIPILQKQVNLLNKKRIIELRKLASEIGETAVGAVALRTSGGYRYRAAEITHQLGKLYRIRLKIYQKKFFMKFLNNFLTQLTPFFFFSVGGYLVIQGDVSIGALVAALAAYKDLSSPWKELLTYYTRAHEMAQRWALVIDHFGPTGTLDEKLIVDPPVKVEPLLGDIVLDNVSAHDTDGITVLQNVNMRFPQGGLVAIAARNEEDRRAMAELLTRELLPSSGKITIGGRNLSEIHQAEIGARVGWADSEPYLFAGNVRNNILMALRTHPHASQLETELISQLRKEAKQSGNAPELIQDLWIDSHDNIEDIRSWWLLMIEAMDADREALHRGIGLFTTSKDNPILSKKIVRLRKDLRNSLSKMSLGHAYVPLDRNSYNAAVPLLQNILFAALKKPISQTELAQHPEFMPLLTDLGLINDVYEMARSVVDILFTTFGTDGTDHPLFQRLNIDVNIYSNVQRMNETIKRSSKDSLSKSDLAMLLALPCLLRPGYIGNFVPEDLQKRIVANRPNTNSAMADFFEYLDPNTYAAGLSVLENTVFGVINNQAGQRVADFKESVIDHLIEHGLKQDVAILAWSEETTLGGANLPRSVIERIGFTRAAIKRPDIFVLNKVLASYDDETRFQASIRLREEMPDATIIYLEEEFRHPENFDVYLELDRGNIVTTTSAQSADSDLSISEPDLATKIQALERTEFFANLDRKQMRLLAFSAQWFEKSSGEVVFLKGDAPLDGAYLILKGEADFVTPDRDGSDRHVRTLGPGSLVGELALVMGDSRSLTMKASSKLAGLRIGGEEFLTVVQNDPEISFKLLKSITKYLSKTTT